MSPITTKFSLVAAALIAVSSTADAKPRRVVVLDFEGPKALAAAGRTSVVNVVADDYDIVSPKRWNQARTDAEAHGRGPAVWFEAARKAGVDAVIEGWVDPATKQLNLSVHDALTGNELQTIAVKVTDKGVTGGQQKSLVSQLTDGLEPIDSTASDAGNSALPTVKVPDRVMLGAKKAKKAPAAEEAPADEAEAAPAPKKVAKKAPVADDAAAPADKADEAKAKTVAIGDEEPGKPTNDLVEIFGTDSKEIQLTDTAVLHKPEPTPRFELSAGGFITSRSLEFVAEQPPTEYPGTQSKGLSLHAAFYPWPTKKLDGRLSGLGITGSVYKSLGSTVTSDEGDQVVDYSVDQNGYDLAVHYRLPFDLVNLDFQAFYGTDNYIIQGASENFDVPDTSYSFIGVGAAVELQITEHAKIGFGAKYFDILDTGDLSGMDWYGPGATSGLALNANFTIPLPQKMFVRGDISYKRFTLEPTGGGQITDDMGVESATDTTVAASVEVGVAF